MHTKTKGLLLAFAGLALLGPMLDMRLRAALSTELVDGPNPDWWTGLAPSHKIGQNRPWTQSVLPNSSSRETRAQFQERLSRAARTRNLAISGPHDYQACRTLIIAGDSNLRGVFFRLTEAFKKAGHVPLFVYPTDEQKKLPCNTKLPTEQCDERWADRTWVFGPPEGGRCTVALLFRMLTFQGALTRVSTHRPYETVFCSGLLNASHPERFAMFRTTPACRDALRFEVDPQMAALVPETPALVWYSHGLWGLGPDSEWYVSETDSVDGSIFDCATRFTSDIKTLRAIKGDHIPLVWQSNFPIVGHPRITNGFLEKDVECHRQTALEQHVPMANLPLWCVHTLARPSMWLALR